MAHSARFIKMLALIALVSHYSVQAEQILTIEQAVQIAIERDPLINVYQSRRDAYREQAIAEDTLPDPKFKLGMMNVPTDTYALNQEPMTQAQFGIQQMFPRGNSLELKSQRAVSMSLAEDAKTENQRRKVTREVRETWLELYYWLNAERVVSKNRKLFIKLVSVTQQQYAAGRQKQQDVIRSELELGMLDDRELKIKTKVETTYSKLAKYIGNSFPQITLESLLPDFKIKRQNNMWLEQHPMLRIEHARVKTSENNVALTNQSYKPSWMVDLTYGQRQDAVNGAKRADFISAMVVVDIPLFTGGRQDKNLAASKLRLNSALNLREERKRELKRVWQLNISKEKHLAQRIKKYKEVLVPKAYENSKSALFSYQSGQGAFTSLMRAQIIEFETQLRALRLEVDHKKAQAQLLYFVGEV